jgi:hypothetical protein
MMMVSSMYVSVVQRSIVIIAAIVAPCFVGCGGTGSATVGGTVNVGDTPLRSGVVCIHASNGRTFSASINDGEFLIRGVPPGKISVTVTSQPVFSHFQYVTPTFTQTPEISDKPEASSVPEPQFTSQSLGKKYGHIDTSPLQYEVRPGRQHIKLALDE